MSGAGRARWLARVSPFARSTLALGALALLGIALTIARGDRVGVRLLRAEPQGETHSGSGILLQFSADMERASVEERLSLQPPLAGEWRWSGRTLRFQPELPLAPGLEVRLTLAAGARSRWGRALLRETTLVFQARSPRALWLGPVDAPPFQIYMAELAEPAGARAITDQPLGVYDFTVAPDGREIIYSAAAREGEGHDLYLLELATGESVRLTQCAREDADCKRPVWRPGRRELAYERMELNRQLPGVSASPTRIWLLDLSGAPRTRPLFADNQQLGHSAQFSADGSALALYDPSFEDAGIVVVPLASDGEPYFVPTNSGLVGALSPNGAQLIFPQVQFAGDSVRTILRRAQLEQGIIADFTPPELDGEDTAAAWHPDGRQLLLARRYDGVRWTHSAQLYLLDTESGALSKLIFDRRYNVSDFSFDAAGALVLMHRFPLLDEAGRYHSDGRPEIWWLELATGQLQRLAVNGFHPRWLP